MLWLLLKDTGYVKNLLVTLFSQSKSYIILHIPEQSVQQHLPEQLSTAVRSQDVKPASIEHACSTCQISSYNGHLTQHDLMSLLKDWQETTCLT